MTKSDRAKMVSRYNQLFGDAEALADGELTAFVASEVDRAVRAERKKWQDDEEQRLERLKQIDAELVDGLKRIGGPKI